MPDPRATQAKTTVTKACPEGALAPAARPVVTRLKADPNPFWFVSGTLLVLGSATLLLYVRAGER